MRRLYIIGEGQTEETFINEILRPYLSDFGIYDVRAILLETSPGFKGGDMKFSRFKKNIDNFLKSEQNIILTSLIDFFRLQKDFPGYEESKLINDKIQKLTFIEKSISEQITDKRFIPYIQLHEFEALLFSANSGFEYIGNIPTVNMKELKRIVTLNAPELINDGPDTAPSKRLQNLIPGYEKPFHATIIAAQIGMPVILQKCPRFNKWITTVIERMAV